MGNQSIHFPLEFPFLKNHHWKPSLETVLLQVFLWSFSFWNIQRQVQTQGSCDLSFTDIHLVPFLHPHKVQHYMASIISIAKEFMCRQRSIMWMDIGCVLRRGQTIRFLLPQYHCHHKDSMESYF